jgi:hypothetical protein
MSRVGDRQLKVLASCDAANVRTQNIRDAAVLLEVIKNNPSPDLFVIWADLSAADVADEVDRLSHLVEWLNLA